MSGFLDALKMRCEVVEVDGGRDFRRDEGSHSIHEGVRWFKGAEDFERAWHSITTGQKGEQALIKTVTKLICSGTGDTQRVRTDGEHPRSCQWRLPSPICRSMRAGTLSDPVRNTQTDVLPVAWRSRLHQPCLPVLHRLHRSSPDLTAQEQERSSSAD